MPDLSPRRRTRRPLLTLALEVCLAVSIVLFLFPAVAGAQTVLPVPLLAQSVPLQVIAILGFVGTLLGQSVNSGVAPKAWIPYLTIGGTFVATVLTDLTQAAAPVTVGVLIGALCDGVKMLVVPGAAVLVHKHATQHLETLAKHAATAAKVLLVCVGCFFGGAALVACLSPAAWQAVISDLGAIGQTVFADVMAGVPFLQLLADTGSEDAQLLVTILTGIQLDAAKNPKLTPAQRAAYVAACAPYLQQAQALAAQQKAAREAKSPQGRLLGAPAPAGG